MARRYGRESNDEQLIDALLALLGNMLATRDGRRKLLIVAILALLAGGAYLIWVEAHRPHYAAGPTVRIATWNLRQFSPTRGQVNLQRFAQIIEDNHFDIVAVQEVKRDGQEVDALVSTLGSDWRSSIGPLNESREHAGGNNERFAFIYNASRVREIGPARLIPEHAADFDREPYEDTFEAGNFRFTLVTVHLDFTHPEKRRQEAETLAAMTNDLGGAGAGDKDVILLGDFNEENQPARANLHFIEERGWERLIHDPTNLTSTEDFDNILIDPRSTTAWSGRSGVVNYDQIYGYRDRKQAVEEVSDHRPAWADFATGVAAGSTTRP